MQTLLALRLNYSLPICQPTQVLPPGFYICDQNMTLERWIVFGLAIAGVLLCMFLLLVNSATETAFNNVSRSWLQELKDEGLISARVLNGFVERAGTPLNLVTTVNAICFIIAPVLATAAIHQFNLYGLEVSLLVIIVGLVLLVFCRAIPRATAAANAQQTARRWSGFANAEAVFFSPAVSFVNWLANLFMRRKPAPITQEALDAPETLDTRAHVVEDEDALPAEEQAMIRSIVAFSDMVVREVMVPRLDIIAAPLNANLDDLVDVILKSGHSRIPIYQDDLDHVVGVLYAKDLLLVLRRPDKTAPFNIRILLRPPYYVPESKRLDTLFGEFQRSRVHIAFVVDEYGGIAGLVTIEDLLEEIVGEIQDEYDAELPEFERLNVDEVLVGARLPLNDVNEFFNTRWVSEDVDTLGGYVYDRLGRIPEIGDSLILDHTGQLRDAEIPAQIGDVQITVLAVSGQRLQKLRLLRYTESRNEG